MKKNIKMIGMVFLLGLFMILLDPLSVKAEEKTYMLDVTYYVHDRGQSYSYKSSITSEDDYFCIISDDFGNTDSNIKLLRILTDKLMRETNFATNVYTGLMVYEADTGYDWMPAVGKLAGNPYLEQPFRDVTTSYTTNMKIFDSYASIRAYVLNGDTSGQINKPPYLSENTSKLSLWGFRYAFEEREGQGALQFSWSGLTLDGSFPLTEQQRVLFPDDIYVDVYVSMKAREDGSFIGEYILTQLPDVPPFAHFDSSSVDSNDNSLQLPNYNDDTRYVTYVKLVPRYADPLGQAEYMHGNASYAYFDQYANFVGYDGQYKFNPITVPSDLLESEQIDEDFYLSEIHTGFDWLDILLNHFVKFVNAILRAIYRIRDLIYNRDGSGLLNLLTQVMYYVNPANQLSYIFGLPFEKIIAPALTKFLLPLVVPSEDFWDEYKAVIDEHFPNLDEVGTLKERLVNVMEGIGSTPPVFTFDFTNTPLAWYGVGSFTISFEWFQPYRPYYMGIISAIMTLRFLFDQFFGIKSIFNAASSNADVINHYS